MSSTERAVAALEAVLRSALRARPVDGPHRDVIVTLDDADFLVRWLPVGWPRQVAEALHDQPQPDVLVAPLMSPGARKAAREAGVGWVDESGAADIYIRDPLIVIETKGSPPVPLDTRVGWRPAALAVCEALLAGNTSPTVSAVVKATGISTGSVATALKFLEHDGHRGMRLHLLDPVEVLRVSRFRRRRLFVRYRAVVLRAGYARLLDVREARTK